MKTLTATPQPDCSGPRRPGRIRVDRCNTYRPSPTAPYLTRLERALEAAFVLAFAECETGAAA